MLLPRCNFVVSIANKILSIKEIILYWQRDYLMKVVEQCCIYERLLLFYYSQKCTVLLYHFENHWKASSVVFAILTLKKIFFSTIIELEYKLISFSYVVDFDYSIGTPSTNYIYCCPFPEFFKFLAALVLP